MPELERRPPKAIDLALRAHKFDHRATHCPSDWDATRWSRNCSSRPRTTSKKPRDREQSRNHREHERQLLRRSRTSQRETNRYSEDREAKTNSDKTCGGLDTPRMTTAMIMTCRANCRRRSHQVRRRPRPSARQKKTQKSRGHPSREELQTQCCRRRCTGARPVTPLSDRRTSFIDMSDNTGINEANDFIEMRKKSARMPQPPKS